MTEKFEYLDRVLWNDEPQVWGTVIRTLPDGNVEVEWDDNVGAVSIVNPQDISHV